MELKPLEKNMRKNAVHISHGFCWLFLSHIGLAPHASPEASRWGCCWIGPYLSQELLYSETCQVPLMLLVVLIHNLYGFGSLLVDALCSGEQRVKQGQG